MITFDFDGYTFKYEPATGLIQKLTKWGVFKQLKQPADNKYLRIGTTSGNVLAHRLAFYAVYGYMPEYVDHINGLKHDQRICNLRDVTATQNNYNVAARSPKSGLKNVYYESRHDKWFAKVVVAGSQVYGPLRCTPDEAYADASTLRTTHHQEYANHG